MGIIDCGWDLQTPVFSSQSPCRSGLKVVFQDFPPFFSFLGIERRRGVQYAAMDCLLRMYGFTTVILRWRETRRIPSAPPFSPRLSVYKNPPFHPDRRKPANERGGRREGQKKTGSAIFWLPIATPSSPLLRAKEFRGHSEHPSICSQVRSVVTCSRPKPEIATSSRHEQEKGRKYDMYALPRETGLCRSTGSNLEADTVRWEGQRRAVKSGGSDDPSKGGMRETCELSDVM